MSAKKDTISIILYSGDKTPRYYSFKKSLVKWIMTLLPAITFLSIVLASCFVIYFNEIRNAAKRKEPAIIQQLRLNKLNLEKEILTLSTEKATLQKKINQGVSSDDGPSFLSFFKKSLGRTDKTSSPEMSFDDVQVFKDNKKLRLRFKLTNLTAPTRKLNGHVFIFMQSGSHITIWPANTFKEQNIQLSFSDGEYFGTTRFRPFDVAFKMPENSNVIFKVFVFNKSGDFVYKKIIAQEISL